MRIKHCAPSIAMPHIMPAPVMAATPEKIRMMSAKEKRTLLSLAQDLSIETRQLIESAGKPGGDRGGIFSELRTLLRLSQYQRLKDSGFDELVNETVIFDLNKFCHIIIDPFNVRKIW